LALALIADKAAAGRQQRGQPGSSEWSHPHGENCIQRLGPPLCGNP
jgi:hypothetical protein